MIKPLDGIVDVKRSRAFHADGEKRGIFANVTVPD